MNVLLTSVGRRSYLVEYFREALQGKGKIIGANMYADAAGMFAVDIPVIVPPANHPEYVECLLNICRQYDVQLLCSLHDLDVYMLSQQRERFHGAGVVTTLPDPEWGRITLDKWECTQIFNAAKIGVPWTSLQVAGAIEALRSGEIKFPLIVKARIGFGSLGLRICHSEKELAEAVNNAKLEIDRIGANRYIALPDDELVLIQEVIEGREVCITVFNDMQGRYLAHFACEVHAMRAGESDLATSLERSHFTDLAKDLSRVCGHVANWGFDCLESISGLKVIDVNPRFTGDYPFHHLAGANLPKALLQLISGNDVNPDTLNHYSGIKMYKDLTPRKVVECSR